MKDVSLLYVFAHLLEAWQSTRSWIVRAASAFYIL